MMRRLLSLLVVAAPLAAACGSPPPGRTVAGVDPASLPQDTRADYAIFARRCSKCHALSRPLDSGITSDAYWALYVAKMQHLPGSGISDDDAAAVLRFLRVYSAQERERQREAEK